MGLFAWFSRYRPKHPQTEAEIKQRAEFIYNEDLAERREAQDRMCRIQVELEALTKGRVKEP